MTLKTLKDIEVRHKIHEIGKCPNCSPSSIGYCSSEELRQAAIEWIKNRKERRNELSKLFLQSWDFLTQEINFWMERFNITDEDLQ